MDEAGERLGKGVCPSGSNATTERGKKTTCGRVKATQSQRRKGFDHLQRKSDAKESASISRDNLSVSILMLVNKIDQFEVRIHELNPDIIGITESWAGSHILDSELAIEGYDLFRKDRSVDRMGGGLVEYCYMLEVHCAQFSVNCSQLLLSKSGVIYSILTVIDFTLVSVIDHQQ